MANDPNPHTSRTATVWSPKLNDLQEHVGSTTQLSQAVFIGNIGALTVPCSREDPVFPSLRGRARRTTEDK